MGLYRKKPVVIEALQYRVNKETGRHIGLIPPNSVCLCDGMKPHLHTAHNGQAVILEDGDWIIPEPGGHNQFYPCKPDIFAATYEEVGAPA